MSELAAALLAATGRRPGAGHAHPAGAATRIDSDGGPVFCKRLPSSQEAVLAAEADGLLALQACDALRVPEVLGLHCDERHAWLFTEWIDLRAPAGDDHARVGEAVAALHSLHGPRFGWPRDNFIGPTPQSNDEDDNWPRFFRERRLRPQLELAARSGLAADLMSLGDALLSRVAAIAGATPVAPSLLHGDLWSGNRAVDPSGRPVLFDPAVHYGHGVCDLAMARLFGGFEPAFYRAWEQVHGPVDEDQVALYQLYHVLNHLNIFGPSYLAQALRLARRLV